MIGKHSPRTPINGTAACDCEVIRPPNDLPPANSGDFGMGGIGAARPFLRIRNLIAQGGDPPRGKPRGGDMAEREGFEPSKGF